MASELEEEREALANQKIERKIVRKARHRVRSRVGFMWHFVAFVLVNLAAVAINLHYSPGYLWFVWLLGGWGVGLLAHAMAVFMMSGQTDSMVEREIEREKQRRGLATKFE
jgi:hypothetical protein